MTGSGFPDPEQIKDLLAPRHSLDDKRKRAEVNDRMIDPCAAKEEGHIQAAVGDRLEGEILISSRQQVAEEEASDRHSCPVVGDSTWRDAKGPGRNEPVIFRARVKSLEPTERANLEGAKHSVSGLSDVGMELNTTAELKYSGNSNRSCRICNKEFSSGRALGGHMRVHGPFFVPGSSTLSKKGYGTPLNKHAEGVDESLTCNQEDDGCTSGVDSPLDPADFEEISPLLRHNGKPVNRTSLPNARNVNVCAQDDCEEVKDLTSDGQERLYSSGNSDPQVYHLDSSEDPTTRKGLLYKLRHNPKRSRWFADQEFAFDASFASLSGKTSVLVDGRRACSDCGKTFLTERALFGHMSSHTYRKKMADFTSENINVKQSAEKMVSKRRKAEILASGKLMQWSQAQAECKQREADIRKSAEVVEASWDAGTAVYHPSADIGGKDTEDEMEAETFVRSEKQRADISSRTLDEDVKTASWQSSGRRSMRKRGLNKAGTVLESRATSSSSPGNEPALTSETISVDLGSEEQEIQTPPDFLIFLADAARKIEEEAELLSSKDQSAALFRSDTSNCEVEEMDDRAGHHDCSGDTQGTEEIEDAIPGPVSDRHVTGVNTGKYECITCKKSFATHQALGGHRASHNKAKGCFILAGSIEENNFEEEVELTKKRKRQQTRQGAPSKGHACSTCNRVFLTGQALGGHKRCHWTGEKPSEATSATIAAKPLSLESNGLERGIDLNMPAPMDEDGAEVSFIPTEVYSTTDSQSANCHSKVDKMNVLDGMGLTLANSTEAWAVTDFLKEDTLVSSPQIAKNDVRARSMFDETWGNHRPNKLGVTQLHQPICAMESIV